MGVGVGAGGKGIGGGEGGGRWQRKSNSYDSNSSIAARKPRLMVLFAIPL